MKKILSIILIAISLCMALNFGSVIAQDAAAQNDMLQQYLQQKQQAQQTQSQQTQQTQQTQSNNTAQDKSALSKWQVALLIVYSVTLILAWINLVLGVFALTRWIKLKKSPAETNKNMIR